MKLLSTSVNSIIYNIFKRQSPILAELIINWGKVAGAKFSLNSQPLKIISSWEKKQRINILYVKASNASIAMEMSYQQDIIMERIAVYFGYKAIHKIKITI